MILKKHGLVSSNICVRAYEVAKESKQNGDKR